MSLFGKRVVTCFYCRKSFRVDSFKRHSAKKHPDLPEKQYLAGSSDSALTPYLVTPPKDNATESVDSGTREQGFTVATQLEPVSFDSGTKEEGSTVTSQPKPLSSATVATKLKKFSFIKESENFPQKEEDDVVDASSSEEPPKKLSRPSVQEDNAGMVAETFQSSVDEEEFLIDIDPTASEREMQDEISVKSTISEDQQATRFDSTANKLQDEDDDNLKLYMSKRFDGLEKIITEKMSELTLDFGQFMRDGKHDNEEVREETEIDEDSFEQTEKDFILNLRSSKSVLELQQKLTSFETLENHLYCVPCSKNRKDVPKSVGIIKQTHYGFFEIPDENAKQRRFRNFKRNIINHLQNPVHIWCEGKEFVKIIERTTDEEMQMDIGLKVARIAYSAMKEGKGGKYFERELNIQNLNGVNVGEINHSRQFYKDMRDHCFDAIREKIVDYVKTINKATNQLPLFSLTADKITLQHRTLQITCVATMVNGVKKVLLLDLVPCGPSHTGDQLTTLLKQSVSKFDLNLKKQLNGMAFDGQYIVLNVPNKMADASGLEEAFLVSQWDLAHKIELSLNDAREETASKWLKTQISIIGDVMKKFKWGIAYEKFIIMAEEMNINYLTPKGYQATRFVQSEFRVYKTFERDFAIFYRHFAEERENAILEFDNTRAKELEREMKKFSKVGFIFKVLFMMDILHVMTKFSCDCQKVDMYLWDIYEKFSNIILRLGAIETSLEKFEVHPKLKNVSTHINDLKIQQFKGTILNALYETEADEDEIGNMPELQATNDSSSLTPDLKNAFKSSKKYVNLLITSLNDRFSEPEVVEDMRSCFSWKNILFYQKGHGTSVPTNVEESLRKLLESTNRNRNTNFSFDAVLNQYYFIWNSLSDIPFVKMKDLPDPKTKKAYDLNCKITVFLFTEPRIYEKSPDLLFLFENCNKLINETICETIGSVVGSHLYNRTVKTFNLMKEVFVTWNGPHIHSADSVLKSALKKRFPEGLHFTRVTKQKSKLKVLHVSEVIDRLRREEENVAFLV